VRKALTICAAPGCTRLVRKGRCTEHKRQRWRQYERRRPDRSDIKAVYASARWRKARAEALHLCPACMDCGQPAQQVDHVQPIREGGDPFDVANLRPLDTRAKGLLR
jgi:5-methylcytosine-specific restriction protein A